MLTLITAIAVAMTISFLCSLMEAGLLSLNPGKLAILAKHHPQTGKICAKLKNDIEKPIAVILILNTTAHTFGAAIAGAQFDKLYGSDYIWLFSLVFTLLMVQYTEILPKTLGVRFNAFVLAHSAKLLKYAIVVMRPIIWLVHFINRPFESKEAPGDAGVNMEEELDALASMARQANHITTMQEQAIQHIPDLKEDKISELMIPRQAMACLTGNMSREEVLAVAKRFPHSRYPVVSPEDPTQFIGVLEIRQLLFADCDWQKFLRTPVIISANEVQLLLAENIKYLDSKLLLVRNASNEIIGMLTTNDLLMKLFHKEEPIAQNA